MLDSIGSLAMGFEMCVCVCESRRKGSCEDMRCYAHFCRFAHISHRTRERAKLWDYSMEASYGS